MKKLLFLLFILTEVCQAQTSAGDNLFNVTQIHTISLNFPQPTYWTLLVNNKAYDDANDSSTYIPAQVIIDGTTMDSVGIQFKGNSSYYGYPGNKKPFTLSFDEYINNQKYDSLSSINLNNCYQDPSFMREKLFLDFLNSKGLNAPRSNYAKLYINGTYWGFYQIGERVNKTFCKDRFGNKGGNLYKGDGTGGACADLKYQGASQASYYNCYTLKTNTTANNWSDLINLTNQINNTTSAQFKDSVDTYLNADSFIASWAACNIFVDFDAYAFRFIHNYYIYHNSATNKFEWITWDASTVFGMDVPGTVASIEGKSILYIEPNALDRPLANRMINDTSYKNQYLTFICDYIKTFQPSVLNPKIDSIYNLIKTDVYADPLKMFSNTEFDNNINSNIIVSGNTYPGLKSFILNRSTNIQNELNTLGVNCSALLGINSFESNSNTFNVYPNPTDGNFIIDYAIEKNEDTRILIIDVLGRTVYELNVKEQVKGNYKQEIFSSLQNGMYTIIVTHENSFMSKKIIINN